MEPSVEASRQRGSRRPEWFNVVGYFVVAFCAWWYTSLTFVVVPSAFLGSGLDATLARSALGVHRFQGGSFFVASGGSGFYAAHLGVTGNLPAAMAVLHGSQGAFWLPWTLPWWAASHLLGVLLLAGVALVFLPSARRVTVALGVTTAVWIVGAVVAANVVVR